MRIRWLRLEEMVSVKKTIAAFAAALVAAIALFWLSPSSAAAASSYRVTECLPGYGVNTADDLAAWGYDNSVIGFGVTCTQTQPEGWFKGIVFHPSTYDPGPRGAYAEFDSPAGTHIDSGSFRYDIGERAPCGSGSCWYADIRLGARSGGIHLTQGMGSAAPNVGYLSWNSCGICTRIWMELECSSFCTHYASPEWTYDYVAMRDLDVTLVDTVNPTLGLSGSLFDSQIVHGTPTLQISANDVGGGVRSVTVEVNGVMVAAPATDCPAIGTGALWATRFRPCENLSKAVTLDTERKPWRDGLNTVRVCVSDVATAPASPNTVCEQRDISVDNSCADSQGAAGRADSISAGLEDPQTGKLQRTRAVRSSEGTALRGELSGGGAPVRAASVCVYETVDDPAGIEQLVQVAKTSSTGKFGVEIPGGPRRSFRVAYRYADKQIESPRVYLDSSVLPTLNLTKRNLFNGQSVGFRGHIPGPHNDGRAVTMQAKVGKKWRSFKQLQTDSHGNFKGKYRFTQTRGRVLYEFRALVKRQGGYPYSPGTSPRRKLVVRG
jgi:hypothetical protein